MKYFQLPEFNSEFEVVKDLKLRVVLHKKNNYYNRKTSAEDELEDLEMKKGTRIVFSGISDRFSPHIHTKGYKFKKLSTKGDKGVFVFIIPFNGIDSLEVQSVESTQTEKKEKKEASKRVTWWNFENLPFYLVLGPEGQPIENLRQFQIDEHTPQGDRMFKSNLIFGLNSETRYRGGYRSECELWIHIEVKKKTVIQGYGFDAKPVKSVRVVTSNPRIKILGKTFVPTAAEVRDRKFGKEISTFLVDMISKGLIQK